MPPEKLYQVLSQKNCDATNLSEQMEWARFFDEDITGSWKSLYIVTTYTAKIVDLLKNCISKTQKVTCS